jgi:hypothetical protein
MREHRVIEENTMNNFPQALTHSSGSTMLLDPTRLLLAFREVLTRDDTGTRINEFGLVLEDAQDIERERQFRSFELVNHTDQHFWVRSPAGRPLTHELFEALQNKLTDQIEWIGPVYRLEQVERRHGRQGLLCPLPNVLVIKPISRISRDNRIALAQRLQQYGLKEVPEKLNYLGDYNLGDYVYHVLQDAAKGNSYQLREILLHDEREFIDEVFFEEMPMLVPYTIIPNDPGFAGFGSHGQWNMIRIQAGGDGATGWDINAGNTAVVIAIIDTGCDLGHPDLRFAPRLDSRGNRISGINITLMGDSDGNTINIANFARGHGTCCAGIAAGVFNNTIGVAGVAGMAHPAVPGWSICSMRVPCAGDLRRARGGTGWLGRDR